MFKIQSWYTRIKLYCSSHFLQPFSFLIARWYWVLTVLIMSAAVLVFTCSPDEKHAAEFGEFLAGFSSALAFLWLIVGLKSQATDLALQRQELALQRVALEKQAKELKNSSKLASLAQIQAILDRANAQIQESGLGIKKPSEIAGCWFAGMVSWKEMLESKNAASVQSRYLEWLKIEGMARGYLGSITSALKLYMEHHLEISFDQTLPNEEFVYINSVWMSKAPFLSEHEGSAGLVANFVFLYGPALDALKVGGMFATAKAFGKDVFKEGALTKMRDDLVNRNITIPAIAKD